VELFIEIEMLLDLKSRGVKGKFLYFLSSLGIQAIVDYGTFNKHAELGYIIVEELG
jgi:hypothetical protein